MGILILVAPFWLYGNSLLSYRLHSDDFPYAAASRTLERTFDHLFIPHNTHIVPVWRVLIGITTALAGSLERLPAAFAIATGLSLVLAMIVLGRVVAKETGRLVLGMAAMIALGTSSLVRPAATWLAAAQALWAGIGVLAMLLMLQTWKRRGGVWRLLLGGLIGGLAGWLWTVGYIAGPVGFVYLATSRRYRAAVVPVLFALAAAGIALGLGAREIDATVSFHGRTSSEAFDPIRGFTHTVQSIPETLLLGNLSINASMTQAQAAVVIVTILAFWLAACRRRGWISPLEGSGAAVVVLSYILEWSFRGYLPFESLRGVVPWYDVIPQIGAILFAVGWASAGRYDEPPATPPICPTRRECVVLIGFALAMLALHSPRVEDALLERAPVLTEAEASAHLSRAAKLRRAVEFARRYAARQRRFLAQLDQAEREANLRDIGRFQIKRVFGRLDAPELPEVYDAADLLDIPQNGRLDDPAAVRRILGPYFVVEPPPST